MLQTNKKSKMVVAIKAYAKKYLHGNFSELDESGTRIMVNTFLTEILCYKPIEEAKTEYMIRGTYADYVVQIGGVRHFLVEVKAHSLALSEKHLRQAINYGANEGIEWALLTNGKNFELHKILFNKPIESRKIFAFDLSDITHLKDSTELVQFLHRDVVTKGGLEHLWTKNVALDPHLVAGILYSPSVLNIIKRTLKQKFKSKFSDEDVENSLNRILTDQIDPENMKFIKQIKTRKPAKQASDKVAAADPAISAFEHTEEPKAE